MSTRANVYVCDEFLTEIPSDAYPIRENDEVDHNVEAHFFDETAWQERSIWALMCHLNEQRCTEAAFKDAVRKYVEDYAPEYKCKAWGGTSDGVGNWSYEYMWVPFEPPQEYREWDNWQGRIYVRQIDHYNTWHRFGSSYFQIPGPWVYIGDWWLIEHAAEPIEESE